MLCVLFAERLGSVNEVLMNEVFKKCISTLHAFFAEYWGAYEKHSWKKKKFLTGGKCDRCIWNVTDVMDTLYGTFGENSWRVYSKLLRINRKSMKCLRSVKILCSHFFDASSSFTFSSGMNRTFYEYLVLAGKVVNEIIWEENKCFISFSLYKEEISVLNPPFWIFCF